MNKEIFWTWTTIIFLTAVAAANFGTLAWVYWWGHDIALPTGESRLEFMNGQSMNELEQEITNTRLEDQAILNNKK